MTRIRSCGVRDTLAVRLLGDSFSEVSFELHSSHRGGNYS
jgi:hypothetical protein